MIIINGIKIVTLNSYTNSLENLSPSIIEDYQAIKSSIKDKDKQNLGRKQFKTDD